MLDAHFQAVFCKDDVPFGKFIAGCLTNFLDGEVDVVPNETEDGEDEEEN